MKIEANVSSICHVMKELLVMGTTTITDIHPSNPFHEPVAGQTTCFALIGADLLVARDGRILVCEVNSHPALGEFYPP